MLNVRRIIAALAIIAVGCGALAAPVRSGDPIKVGFSMALTGSVAQNGKQLIMALELWRDDINASGGLLGRPVELVYYDDQSNPSNVPGIYTKLITVDKVDLLLGPYGSIRSVMPSCRSVMRRGRCWRRRWKRPKASIKRNSPITSTTTPFIPWSARSITPPTALGRNRARCSRNFRTWP